MHSQVTFANGNVLMTDGTLIEKSGKKRTLKYGDCLDQDGNFVDEGNKEVVPIK